MSKQHTEAPQFIEVAMNNETAYITFEQAISNPDLRSRVMQKALSEASEWCQRYAAFFQRIEETRAMDIVNAIQQAEENLQDSDNGLMFDSDESCPTDAR